MAVSHINSLGIPVQAAFPVHAEPEGDGGSVRELERAAVGHFDVLRVIDTSEVAGLALTAETVGGGSGPEVRSVVAVTGMVGEVVIVKRVVSHEAA